MRDPYWLSVAFVFGAVIGSFLNVCIVRLPADLSVVRPPSRCPECQRGIAWYDNIPVLSWLILLGKCRHCKARISWQYPMVELAVGLLFVGAVWHWGLTVPAVRATILGTLLLGIAATDAKHFIIPDEFTLGGLVVGLGLSLFGGVDGFTAALLGAIVGFGVLWVVGLVGQRMFKEEAMGGGDIKMMAMLGAFTDWQGVLLTIFLGALIGSVVFIPLALRKKRLVPFGIFLALGGALTFLIGEQVIGWYFQFMQAG